MARAHSTATHFPFVARPAITFTFISTSIPKIRQYPKILASHGSSTPFQSKRIIIKRKNHLRPKILKTLTKPLPQTLPTTEFTHPIPIPLQPLNDTDFDSHNGIASEIVKETDTYEEFRVSDTVIEEKRSNLVRISAKSVLQFCGWLVGAYLFQVIWTVWVLGNNHEQERFDSLDSKVNAFMNGNNVGVTCFDESEMEGKISEIKAMAREVRESEKRNRKEGNDEEESEIEKEVGARLVKLEKRLNAKKEKSLPDSFMKSYLGFSGNDDDEEDGDGENGMELNDVDLESLMFKKKFRFKGPSMNSISSPKGFSGSRDSGISTSVNGSGSNGESGESDFESMNLEKEKEDLQSNLGSGAEPKITEGSSSTEVTEASKSRDVENLRSLTKGNQRITTKFDRPASSSINGSRDPGKRPMPNNAGGKQSAVKKKYWWLDLPYVLVILMRSGSEREGQGLYTLRTLSEPDDHVDSYTIAFEDCGDANNFCHLLEFYLEDLGDFSADIVPLSVKVLYEGVESGSKKVIVVKKGQLKLYAGQPFAEVEMALFSLLEQDQGTS